MQVLLHICDILQSATIVWLVFEVDKQRKLLRSFTSA